MWKKVICYESGKILWERISFLARETQTNKQTGESFFRISLSWMRQMQLFESNNIFAVSDVKSILRNSRLFDEYTFDGANFR